MSTSSKPRHGDPVVQVSKNELGETVGIPTRQFQEFLDEIDENVETAASEPEEFGPLLLGMQKKLQDQVGSGEALTFDTTGFTWDSSVIFFDQTES